MSRVKYGAKMEYEYLDNFKILQKAFKTHGIDKVRPGSFRRDLRGEAMERRSHCMMACWELVQ